MRVSVIIPTLEESTTIAACLSHLAGQAADEVIVVDGSSGDDTASLAERAGARVLAAPPGRGAQQNLGAAIASGEILLFLHADCSLESGAVATLRRFLSRNPSVPGGCFRMRVAAEGPAYRCIDSAAHLRAGVLGLPYGDQGLFAARWAFDRVGGFPEVRLMDDLFLSTRLRRLGRLALLRPRISVSPRRWQRRGLIAQTLRNWSLIAQAALGTSPDLLATHYPADRDLRLAPARQT